MEPTKMRHILTFTDARFYTGTVQTFYTFKYFPIYSDDLERLIFDLLMVLRSLLNAQES